MAPGAERVGHPTPCDDLGLEHLWVVYPGDRQYPLTDDITALPLTRIRDIELRPPE